MIIRSILIFVEVLFITIMNYYTASNYFSLDVLYCLPVIQTARLSALQRESSSGSYTIHIIAVTCAIAWSAAEAFVVWPNFPFSAILMNILTRAVTFTIIARVIAKLWKDKEIERKDYLTGLSNREEMNRKLEEMQLLSDVSGSPYTIMFVNIDRFRAFNAEHGYQSGDQVLKKLAATLQVKIKYEDMIARIAGDEFVILLHDTDDKLSQRMGARLSSAVKAAFNENGWDLNLSYGCITDTGKTRSVDDLIRMAGENMKAGRKALQMQIAAG
jgi:diguanylate cyclase (GGDEF)-like protein